MADRVEKFVTLKAVPERVWQALTDPAEFGAWFRVALDGPFREGEVTTGQITYPGYEHIRWWALVRAVEEPAYFAFEWPHPAEPGGDPDGAPRTLVEFRLQPAGSGTRLSMAESGFGAIPADRRVEAMRRNEGGWEEQARNIAAYLGE